MTDTPTPDTSPEALEDLAAALLRALQQETATAASRVIHVLTTQADEITRLRALLERAREGLKHLGTANHLLRAGSNFSYGVWLVSGKAATEAEALITEIEAELGGTDA